ncbi:ABC transporter permease [Chryseolinea sp. H1M3-3]|uniref:ABC transporter permease n=1 Tax=Chryseolinea sp. H1M3-3 TaxID=3034144 RepID=UPI0023ECC270|nr:ABC transporter permease [Chryseolinea sp. H1M3-3]
MLRNNFKITVRSLGKNKVSSAINIFGLTVGLTSCLLISLYIQHEASFDAFQKNGKRIARVIMEYSFDGSTESKRGNFTSTKVAPEFSRTFPEVEYGIRMTDRDMIVKHNDNAVTEPYFLFADSTFFKIFSADVIHGNPDNALNGPNKVVLTESTANKYFGDENPLGKMLLTGSDEEPYEVTGVVRDYPSNSQIKFDFLASFSSLGANQEETYFDANYTTYLLLKDENAFDPLQKKITPFMEKAMAGSGASVNFMLERFDKIHLHSEYTGFVPNTSITYLYILSGVAMLILVIVSFTYINLSTARSIARAKEVGIRKSIGAARSQLFWQFINESVIICLVAVVLSFQLIFLSLPFFNQLIKKELPLASLLSLPFIGFSLLVALTVSFAAGSYPAIILSGFQPVKVLKGIIKTDSAKWVQQSLIVFQFAISVFLIVATLIIQNQLYFIQHKKLGYDRNHIVVLPMHEQVLDRLSVIKQEFKTHPAVENVSRCVSTPVKIAGGYNMRSAAMGEQEQISVTATPVDEDYIKTTGLEIIAGTDLTEQDIKDVSHKNSAERTYHFILNESAAKELGWSTAEAVGKKMFMGHREGFVKGVIRDFHFESMHTNIKPLVLFTEIRSHGNLLVKVNGQELSSTISFLEAKWKQLLPFVPFEYHFLDDDYNSLYQSEQQLGTVMNLFSGIAIVLACLGLFGLSTFVVQQRIKEIGIRKILGASLVNIVKLLSGKFTMLVLLAVLLASPLAYLLMKQWLQGFAYRTEISGWTFVIAALSALAIAFFTVSLQSIKAALSNPAETLKSE